MGILQLQALHSENQGNGEEICQVSRQQMAQGLVVFPSFNLDISIFYLRSFYCEQFVEIVNKGWGCYNNRSLFPIDTFKLGVELHRRMREFEVLHLENVPLNK